MSRAPELRDMTKQDALQPAEATPCDPRDAVGTRPRRRPASALPRRVVLDPPLQQNRESELVHLRSFPVVVSRRRDPPEARDSSRWGSMVDATISPGRGAIWPSGPRTRP